MYRTSSTSYFSLKKEGGWIAPSHTAYMRKITVNLIAQTENRVNKGYGGERKMKKILCWQSRNENDRSTSVHFNSTKEIRLHDSKGPLEETLLSEQGL